MGMLQKDTRLLLIRNAYGVMALPLYERGDSRNLTVVKFLESWGVRKAKIIKGFKIMQKVEIKRFPTKNIFYFKEKVNLVPFLLIGLETSTPLNSLVFGKAFTIQVLIMTNLP